MLVTRGGIFSMAGEIIQGQLTAFEPDGSHATRLTASERGGASPRFGNSLPSRGKTFASTFACTFGRELCFSAFADLKQEVSLWHTLKHTHILELHETYNYNGSLYMVYE